MIGFIILGILYEGLKAGRDRLRQRDALQNKANQDAQLQLHYTKDWQGNLSFDDELQNPLIKSRVK